MVRRRYDGQGRKSDEILETGGGTGTIARPAGTNVHDHLTSLQRDYGNAAVANMVVQRKDRPQSTDAPGYKPPKDKGKKGPAAKAEVSFAPTDHIPGLENVSTTDLTSDATDFASRKDGNEAANHERASRDYLELWFRTPGKSSRSYALALGRLYKEMPGHEKQAAFWMKVQSGEIDPKAPKPEPGSDQHF